LKCLAKELPKSPESVLSIGSGKGLLEQLLKTRYPSLDIQGVEIQDAHGVNKYLPERDVWTILGSVGSSGTCDRAAVASAWMFVYPRSPLLVRNYIREFGDGKVKILMWLGPRNDWNDFAPYFEDDHFEAPEEVAASGLPTYELMAVVRKRNLKYEKKNEYIERVTTNGSVKETASTSLNSKDPVQTEDGYQALIDGYLNDNNLPFSNLSAT
jgi:hypothetical protein